MRRDGDAHALGRERLLTRWKRWRANMRALPPLLLWTLRLALLLGPVVVASFSWVAVVDGSWAALRLLTGEGDAERSGAPMAAVALVLSGWLLVPSAVGALVGIAVDRAVTRSRGRRIEDVEQQVSDDLLDGEPP